MPAAEPTIERLSPAELTSPAYRRLASTLFGSANWERHVRYCRWLYEENPAARRDQPLPIYVCRVGDELIGHRGIVPTEIFFDGQRVRAGWGVDHFILPAHQRKNVAGRLHVAAARDCPLLLSLGQTDAAYYWAVKHGYCATGALTRYARLLRPLRGVPKIMMEKAGLARAAQRLFGAGLSTGRARHDFEVAAVPSFAERVGDIGDLRGANRSGPRVCRTPAFMQWRYLENPFFKYEVRRLKLGDSGEAYAVWRRVDDPRWRRARLVDLIYPDQLPHAQVARIIAVVMDCMRAEGIGLVQCETSDTAVIAALGTSLFSTSEPGPRFLYSFTDDRPRTLTTAADWCLYPGDSDVDTYMVRSIRS